MRETEHKRAWAENKSIGREELGRIHDEEDPRGAGEALAIPDYVMRDFGLPEEDEKEDRDNGIRTQKNGTCIYIPRAAPRHSFV